MASLAAQVVHRIAAGDSKAIESHYSEQQRKNEQKAYNH